MATNDTLIQAGNNVVASAQNTNPSAIYFQDGSGLTSNNTPIPAPSVVIPKVIDSTMIKDATPVSLPTQTPPQPAPQLNMADQILKKSEVPDTQTQKTATELSQRIYDLIPKLAGETQALSDAQKAAGVDTKKQELQNLNSQILKLQAEMTQDDVNLVANSRAEETRDTLLPFAQSAQAKLAGDAAILRALKSSQVGVLNAQVLAKQGDIQLAMDTAKQAVDVKYAPYKEAINLYQQQLQALQPILTKDEQKQAKAQELKTQLALKELEDRKAKEKDNLALAFSSGLQNKFINKNGEIFRSSDGKSYSTPEEFFKDAGVTSFDEAYSKGLIGDLSQNLVADKDFVNKLRATYPDAGITLSDTAATATAKLKNSAIFQKDTYSDNSFTLSEGQTRYDSNGNIIATGPQKSNDIKKNLVKVNGRDYLVDENGNLTEPQVPQGQVSELKNNALNSAKELLDKLNAGKGAVGTERIVGAQKIPGTTSYDFDVQFRNLKSLLSLDNVKLLKGQGQVSDAERQLLADATSKLDLGMSKKEFKKSLEDIVKSLSNPAPENNQSGGNVWQDPSTGQYYEFPDQDSLNKFKKDNGISFNSVGNTKASNLTLASAVSKAYPTGSDQGQCAVYVEKLVDLGTPGNRVGTSLKQKQETVNKYGISKNEWASSPKAGDAVVFNYGGYGHIAVVTQVLPGGKVRLTESNYNKDGKVTNNRVVSVSDPGIYGALRGQLKLRSI